MELYSRTFGRAPQTCFLKVLDANRQTTLTDNNSIFTRLSKPKMKSSDKSKSDALKMLASAANSISKPSTPIPPTTDGLTGAKNTLIDSMHNYFDADNCQVQVSFMEEDYPPLPITPTKPLAVSREELKTQRRLPSSPSFLLSRS